MTERDEQQQRHDLFEMLGVLADVTDGQSLRRRAWPLRS
jgi:hypothetical protein